MSCACWSSSCSRSSVVLPVNHCCLCVVIEDGVAHRPPPIVEVFQFILVILLVASASSCAVIHADHSEAFASVWIMASLLLRRMRLVTRFLGTPCQTSSDVVVA